jgi:hypothetical protein
MKTVCFSFTVSNEIPPLSLKRRNSARSKVTKASVQDSTICVLCEFALSKIDEELKDGATEVRKY